MCDSASHMCTCVHTRVPAGDFDLAEGEELLRLATGMVVFYYGFVCVCV